MQNYSDWERTEYFTQRGVPQSCCRSQDDCSEEDLKDLSKAKLKVFVDVSEAQQIPLPVLEVGRAELDGWRRACPS